MKNTLIYNTTIINEGQEKFGAVVIEGELIKEVIFGKVPDNYFSTMECINAEGLLLLPGAIDDQVHFREPGLTHKAEIYTESKAAVAGGITSYMEMPNTNPQSTTIELLEEKYQLASQKSLANYSFYLGATNDNIEEVKKISPKNICGLKVFMGSSTGNMLVDNAKTLERIFKESPVLIATHCEDEATIQKNTAIYKEKYREEVPISCHPEIRNDQACYLSSSLAVKLAKEHGARLHVLHISTAKELDLFDDVPLSPDKKITSEVCVHHLWFQANDYEKKGTLIKWNPAVKYESDKKALLKAIQTNKIDVVATDHAPHTKEEKENTYFKAPSGGPMVQHALVSMLELSENGTLDRRDVVKKMCHNPATLYNINRRGFIRKGYFADFVLINPNSPWTVSTDNILYKCKWSPMEGITYKNKVEMTFVNGNKVYESGIFDEETKGKRLYFNR